MLAKLKSYKGLIDNVVEIFTDGLWMIVLSIGLLGGFIALVIIDALSLVLLLFKYIFVKDDKSA